MTRKGFCFVLVSASSMALSSFASATPQGQSSSYSIYSNLAATSSSLNISAQPSASGTAPSPYNVSNSLSSFSQGTAGQLTVSTGQLGSTAASNVDGTSGSKNTTASAFADGVSFQVGGGTVGFTANVVAANSLGISGNVGSYSSSGYADFSGASLTILGNQYFFDTIPAANTVMYSSSSLTVIANKQSIVGNGTSSLGISITALDFEFTNFAENGQLLNGEIAFGNAQALVSNPAPEPVTMLLVVGAAGSGVRKRLRTS